MFYLFVAIVVFIIALGIIQLWMYSNTARLQGRHVPVVPIELHEKINSLPRSVLYFYSDKCHNCKRMEPLIKSMMNRHNNIIPINASRNIDVARKFNIRATPTTLLITGNKIEKILLGSIKEKQFAELLREYPKAISRT